MKDTTNTVQLIPAIRRGIYEKEGWREFDPKAPPYTPPQVAVAAERDRINKYPRA